MFQRILIGQSESDVYWISTPNNNCTCDIGKIGISDQKDSICFAGKNSANSSGFLTKLSSLGIQQGSANFGGGSEPYVFRACDMRGNNYCHTTGWNETYLVAPIAGVDFAISQTYRNHFWRTNNGGTIALGIYAMSGAGYYSGTVYLCGQWLEFIDGEFSGVTRPWIAKLVDASIVWSVIWSSPYTGAFTDVAVLPNGNIVAAGPIWRDGEAGNIVIFNPSTGATISQKQLISVLGINSIAVDTDGNILVGGKAPNSWAYVSKVSGDLSSIIWQKRYVSNQINNVALDSAKNVVAIGSSGTDAIIYKFDTNGNLLWQRTFATSGTDVGYGLAVGANDSIYAKIQCGAKVVIAKLPPDGSLTGTYGSYTYAAGATTLSAINLGMGAATNADEGDLSGYPYTRGNWGGGSITWTGANIP